MPTVLIGGLPAARVTDAAACVGPPDLIVKGSFNTLIGGLPAARMTDTTVHGGIIVAGLPTVLICDAGAGTGDLGGTNGGAQADALIAAAGDGKAFCQICPA